MDLASACNDVLTEILLRLPAKSLVRFKSVCKKWLSLISSNHFCHQHTLRRPKLQPSLIIQMCSLQFCYFNQTIDGKKVMIPYSPSVPDHKILQGCNGLLLLESLPSYYECERKNTFYVYNPTTRQSREITLTRSDNFPYVESVSLAFDPSKSPFYKVVCVRFTSYSTWDSYAYQIKVYDSESHTWKLCLEPSRCPRISTSGVYWNNSIFWRTRDDPYGTCICCFDIAKNEIKILSFPQYYARPVKHVFADLQESNGHLYCFELVNDYCFSSVAVWELGGDDHSWNWKDEGDFRDYQVPRGNIIPLRLVAGDGATCSFLVHDSRHDGMMAYNFLDNSYELLVRSKVHPIDVFSQRVGLEGFQFGETLALV